MQRQFGPPQAFRKLVKQARRSECSRQSAEDEDHFEGPCPPHLWDNSMMTHQNIHCYDGNYASSLEGNFYCPVFINGFFYFTMLKQVFFKFPNSKLRDFSVEHKDFSGLKSLVSDLWWTRSP